MVPVASVVVELWCCQLQMASAQQCFNPWIHTSICRIYPIKLKPLDMVNWWVRWIDCMRSKWNKL